MLYGVLCRLARPAGEYATLLGAVQSIALASWRVTDSTWLVESDEGARAIRDAIAAAVDAEDLALVFPLDAGPAVWTSLAHERYGRRFLERALERAHTTRA